MTAPDDILRLIRECQTTPEIEALKAKHAADMKAMDADPEIAVRAIHIRNLAKLKRSDFRRAGV